MANLRLVPRDLDAEALHWLNLAKRALAGEISPEEAVQAMKRDFPGSEILETKCDLQT